MVYLPIGVALRGERAPLSTPLNPATLSSVAPTQSRGRGLYATQKFFAGQCIGVFDKPLVAITSNHQWKTVCGFCLDGRRKAKACTGCRAVVYCSKNCQRADWSHVHRYECKMMGSTLGRATLGLGVMDLVGQNAATAADSGHNMASATVTTVRALVQVLLQGSTVKDAIDGMEGHVEAFRMSKLFGPATRGRLWDEMTAEAKRACGLIAWATRTDSGTQDVQEGNAISADQVDMARQILCKLQVNGFDRCDPDAFDESGGQSGLFVDGTLSNLNHSCVPTAAVIFVGRKGYLRAQQDLSPGDEITISYVDYTKPKSIRSQSLERYHFVCGCPRCVDDLDVYAVCRTSRQLPLNASMASFTPDLAFLCNPPIEPSPTPATVDTIYRACNTEQPVSPLERLTHLRRTWVLCQPLVLARRWAVEPLAHALQQAVICFADRERYAHALAVECFVMLNVDPFRFPAPFSTSRLIRLLIAAKAISNLSAEPPTEEFLARFPKRMMPFLLHFTDGRVFEALLRLVMHNGTEYHAPEWQPLDIVRDLLGGLDVYLGREVFTAALHDWIANPSSPQSVKFFRENLIQPIEGMADMAVDLITTDLVAEA